MKRGDLVLFTDEDEDLWIDRLGIITSFDTRTDDQIWVHWFESGEEQWATQDQLEILSETR